MSSLAGFCVLVPSLGHFNFPVLNKIWIMWPWHSVARTEWIEQL
jgi:hypothetical protein